MHTCAGQGSGEVGPTGLSTSGHEQTKFRLPALQKGDSPKEKKGVLHILDQKTKAVPSLPRRLSGKGLRGIYNKIKGVKGLESTPRNFAGIDGLVGSCGEEIPTN